MSNGWPPAPAPPAKKKTTSTLSIVLAILGGGMLLVAIVVGIGIYVAMTSAQGRAIVGFVSEGMKILANAKNAPGTKELRAMGCHQAMVLDTAELQKLTRFVDGGGVTRSGPDRFREIVVCQLERSASSESMCDRVASTYVGVVGPRPEPLLVQVQKAPSPEPDCSNLYDERANFLKPLRSDVGTQLGGDAPDEPAQ